MKRKALSMILVASMFAGLAAGCGSNGGEGAATDNQSATTESATTDDAATDEAATPAADEGKVLNIYVWNEEFKTRMAEQYPGYEAVDEETGKIGDVTVKWQTTANTDNAYQNNLDEHLLAQADATDDDKVDIFLVEADYALKYCDSDATLPLSEIGLGDDVFADQYQYTKDVVTANGQLKGASWQGCPGALIYRRDIAKDVLGSDEPAVVQAAVSDWDTYKATASKMKEAGYKMNASVSDSFRVFSNNVTSKWVENGEINIDPNIQKWVELSKAMYDAGETDTYGLWGDDWSKGFYESGDVFCYFGPAWFIDFCMSCDQDGSVGSVGGWGVTEGPQGFFWGGTWICAANGTDNPTLVADIIKTMTTDDAVLTNIVNSYSDFVNDQNVMTTFAEDENFGNDYLGGQNPYGIFASGVSSVDLSNISPYDQGCNEEFQNAMTNYFEGNATYDEALELFYTKVCDKYPELKK